MSMRISNILFTILLIVVMNVEGKKQMDTSLGLPKVTIPFKQYLYSLFPLPDEGTFGMIAGKNDDATTVRIVTIEKDRFHENEIPRSAFEPASQVGEKAPGSPYLFLLGNRNITILDIDRKKEVKSYWGVGNVLYNTYTKAKVIDFEKQLVLTLFDPYYDETYKNHINNTFVLTIENIQEISRIKQVPISTLSGRYKKRNENVPPPQLFFGSTFTVYRESPAYDWLCVDNDLDPVEHPLRTILNDNKALFSGKTMLLLDMKICEQQKLAAVIYRREVKPQLLLIKWDRDRPVIPVPVKEPVTPSFKNFSLSPSGKWLYFEGTAGVHDIYCGSYLAYLDPTLPNIAFPPVKIDMAQSPEQLTWITSPEGLLVFSEKAFHYWDLSKFDSAAVKGGG